MTPGSLYPYKRRRRRAPRKRNLCVRWFTRAAGLAVAALVLGEIGILVQQMGAELLAGPLFLGLALAAAGGAVACTALGSLEATEVPGSIRPRLPAASPLFAPILVRLHHPARFAFLMVSSWSALLFLGRLLQEPSPAEITEGHLLTAILWIDTALLGCIALLFMGWLEWMRRARA